jgi:hypothetical protein
MVRIKNLTVLAIASIAFLAICVFLWDAYDLSGVRGPSYSESQTNDAENLLDAIVVLSAGDVENTMVDGFLESISGLNSAPIYVFTDRPECVDASKYDTSKYQVHIQQIEIEFFSLLSEKVSTIHLKRYKTTLFRYLPETINRVLYIDRDIRFTESFGTWRPPQFSGSLLPEGCDIMFAGESRSFDGDAYNSGVIVMERDTSADCLKDWEDQITSRKYQMDQDAFSHTTKCSYCTLSKDSVLYVKSVSNYFRFSAPTQPMIHYTTSSHKKKSVIQEKCNLAKKESWFGMFDEHCMYATFGDSMGFFLEFEDKKCILSDTSASADTSADGSSPKSARRAMRGQLS